uniref:Uncharacterized protein n=1 Tax=Glossina pallidipes TaxID=7398 RepID=A0A1A9Z5W3_GLOPL
MVEWFTLTLLAGIRFVKLSSRSTAAKSAWSPKSSSRPLLSLSSKLKSPDAGTAAFASASPSADVGIVYLMETTIKSEKSITKNCLTLKACHQQHAQFLRLRTCIGGIVVVGWLAVTSIAHSRTH